MILAPPSGRRPGADAPPCPPLATPLVQGEGVGRGMPVSATITEQKKYLDLQTKLIVS